MYGGVIYLGRLPNDTVCMGGVIYLGRLPNEICILYVWGSDIPGRLPNDTVCMGE